MAFLGACVICGATFVSAHLQECCSRTCGSKLGKQRSDVTRSANAMARHSRTCERCGNTFVMRNPSGKARRGETHEGRFCSRKCQAATIRIYATKTDAKRAERSRARERDDIAPPSVVQCTICGSAFEQRDHNSRLCSDKCRAEDSRRRAFTLNKSHHLVDSFRCAECGRQHTPAYGDKSRVYCSQRCGRRAVNRIRHKIERARLRTQTVEPVNPNKVFDRDRWRCQLCGCKTPRKLRGTIEANAPELDHIVPLSVGGEHSYRNTQCACRACNGAKADKPLGQTRLFA
jgi:5-methylcytosine-specific restriction endonuclease McrA